MDVRHTRFFTSNLRPASLNADNSRFVGLATFLAFLSLAILLLGCGGPTADNAPTAPSNDREAVLSTNQTSEPAAVVSQFLDRVRRGGSDSNASELLTKLAQQEMTRIGRPLQFPGSPDTSYRVGQSVEVPDQTNTIWVQTILSEPTGRPEPELAMADFEVVWTLRKESDQWKIAGFALDQGEELPPMEINFENGAEMEARLAAIESEDATSNR